MKKLIFMATTALSIISASPVLAKKSKGAESFEYNVDKFADLQILRYRVPGFEELTPKQRIYIYYLSEAAQTGRDILFDQNGKYNLAIRRTLESIYKNYKGDTNDEDYKAFTVYLKQVWFANGIHHHYSTDKFTPAFSKEFLINEVKSLPAEKLPLREGETADDLLAEILPVIFDPAIMAKRVNLAAGEDLIKTSACNYYDGVTQQEAEEFYAAMRDTTTSQPISYGLNSRLVKRDGRIYEETYKIGGRYSAALEKIAECLEKAKEYAENEEQKEIIETLVEFNRTGDLKTFDEYCIKWVEELSGTVDFICGFTEELGEFDKLQKP